MLNRNGLFEVCLAPAWGAFFKVVLLSLISARTLSIASSSRDILLQVTGLMVLEKALEKDCTFPVPHYLRSSQHHLHSSQSCSPVYSSMRAGPSHSHRSPRNPPMTADHGFESSQEHLSDRRSPTQPLMLTSGHPVFAACCTRK